MRIIIENAQGDVDEIRAAVVAKLISEHAGDLELISAQQACGICDLTMNSFNDLELPKVDLLGNGRVIRYKLSDLKAKIEERTIKPLRRSRVKKTSPVGK